MTKTVFANGDVIGNWVVLSDPYVVVRSGYKRWVAQVRCKCGAGYEKILYDLSRNAECVACSAKRKGIEKRQDEWEKTVSQALNSYRQGAISRKLTWEISREEFTELIQEECAFCDAPPSNQYRPFKDGRYVGQLPYQGIDRLDNLVGYTMENTVPCCKICNRAKNNLSMEEWEEYLDRIATKRR